MPPSIAPTIEVHLDATDLHAALVEDALRGLTTTPKELPPKWFYDERGSSLFEEITRLPEYYLTRREREILYSEAVAVARVSKADTLVELGSGTSEKTRLLLDALSGHGSLRSYVPFDVSESVLRTAAQEIAERYAGVTVHALVGDFEHHLELIPSNGRRLLALLGSTIGNFLPSERVAFLRELGSVLETHDWLLLGFDLVKADDRLNAAYNDAAGVTAAFNTNVLSVLNRELGADFVPARFEHLARYEPEHEWIAMYLRSTSRQEVRVDELGLAVSFGEGELMRTEISAKFTRQRVEAELGDAGLVLRRWWTDSHDDFALALAQRNSAGS